MNTPQQTPLPFESPPTIRKSRKHKRHHITTASALLFDEVKTHRNKAFLMILTLLTEFDYQDPQLCLTAREMLRVLKVRDLVKPTAERNYLSPRLTELFDYGCVENPQALDGEGQEEPFIKHINGDAAASVWRITDKGRELLSCLTQLHMEGKP